VENKHKGHLLSPTSPLPKPPLRSVLVPTMQFNFPNVTNSSVPSHGWVPQQDNRGTLDIIWSCLTTLFICLWVQLHLNVPSPDETLLQTSLRRLRWLLYGALVPEFLLLASAGQYASAKMSLKDMKALGYEDNWSMSHGFFADSGGFLLVPPDTPPFAVTGKQIHYLVARKHMEMPEISRSEIVDKSKGDKFTKTLACLQTCWFLTQSMVRLIQQLPISPIELQTCSIILCTIVTYLFWFSKPLDATTPIRLAMTTRIADVLVDAGDAAAIPYRQTPLDFVEPNAHTGSLIPHFSRHVAVYQSPTLKAPNDRKPQLYTFLHRSGLGATVILFSSFSFVEWYFVFPSRTEKLMWRCVCVISQSSLFVHAIIEAIAHRKMLKTDTVADAIITYFDKYKMEWPYGTLFWCSFLIYLLARTIIIVLAIIALRDLPLGCYITVSWTGFVPHL
jgi:hypothetical protein